MPLSLFVTLLCLTCIVYPYSTPFNLSLANTTFNGIDTGDNSGISVSSAGDFNNDGFDDILIGALLSDANGISNAVSSAGDFNSDGFDDILIGAYQGTPNGNAAAGETYLIFGSNQPLGSQFNLSSINGTNGIIFNGIDANDESGYSVSSAGDFNNDGFDNILIGAPYADPNGNADTGEACLIFGTNQPLGSQFTLSSIDGTNGVIFNGIDGYDYSGWPVSSAGDFNNDGFADILIGATYAIPNGNSDAGETYLILGEYFPPKEKNDEETVSVAIIHTLSCLVLCLCVLVF